jgi:RHS repeat-associated protein
MQPRFDRGYTGQEQMAGFALINLNGRMYDPYLQRFLSPDNEIQSPGDAQSYNRYTYCMNNPLLYTDPSGYTWFTHLGGWVNQNWKPILTTIATAAIITAACLIPGVGEAALLGAYFNVALQAVSGNNNIFTYSGFISAVGVGALTGMIGGGIGALASTITQAGYVIPGVVIGVATGGISGAISGGLAQGLNNYLLGNGDFWGGLGQGAIMGLITGGILGGIMGGIQGYQNAEKAGVNPWTGEMDDARTYCSSNDGVDPKNFKQPRSTEYCYAYSSAFANPSNPYPQSYLTAMEDDDGDAPNAADMTQVALNMKAQHVYLAKFSDLASGINENFDDLGNYYNDGYSITSGTFGHGVVITQFTVVDKINFFFGGNHQIVQNVLMMDPLKGAIVPGGDFMSRGSIFTITKW